MDRIQSFVNGLPSRLLPESLARYDIGRMPGNPHGRDTVAKLHSRHASEVTVSLTNGRRSHCLPLSFSPTFSSSPSVFLSTFPVLKHCEYTDVPNCRRSKQQFVKSRVLKVRSQGIGPSCVYGHLCPFYSAG